MASATAFSLSEDGIAELHADIGGLPRPDHPAPAGDQQPSGGHPPARLPGDERHDRGRHLRQRQLHPPHGLEHPERHRRLRRLRPQRLHLDLRHPVDGQGRGDLVHRADGQPRRSHRARRARDRHRAGPGRPARPGAAAPRPADHRPLRPPRLPARAAGLLRPRDRHRTRQAHPPPAQRGVVMACAVPARRHDAARLHNPPKAPNRSPCSADGQPSHREHHHRRGYVRRTVAASCRGPRSALIAPLSSDGPTRRGEVLHDAAGRGIRGR